MEKKMPLTKQMANHLNLVLKLRDEASRTLRRKGDQTHARVTTHQSESVF